MNQVLRRQLGATEEFQRQATPEFQKSLGETGPIAGLRNIQQGASESSGLAAQLARLPYSSAASPIPTDPLVQARTAADIGRSTAANAALQGFSNFSLQQWLADQRARQNLGVLSGLAGSRSEITPYLLSGAQNKGQDLAAVGSLLGTAGSLAGTYGQLYPYLSQRGGT